MHVSLHPVTNNIELPPHIAYNPTPARSLQINFNGDLVKPIFDTITITWDATFNQVSAIERWSTSVLVQCSPRCMPAAQLPQVKGRHVYWDASIAFCVHVAHTDWSSALA